MVFQSLGSLHIMLKISSLKCYTCTMSEFDLTHYVKASTKASGVPLRVKNKNALDAAARLVMPRLPTRS
jgi:hypothetical protein